MAKRGMHHTQRRWEPNPSDAINLATVRWFALAIEAKAIEIYGTDRTVYPEILAALNKGLSAINTVNVKKPIADEGDCPPGWVRCNDDCAPACSEENED
jgi:hypothetical protein